MTDLVVGGGAVGSFVGWALASGGRDVAIVRRSHDGPPQPAELTAVDPDGEGTTVSVTEVRAPMICRRRPS